MMYQRSRAHAYDFFNLGILFTFPLVIFLLFFVVVTMFVTLGVSLNLVKMVLDILFCTLYTIIRI